MARVVTGAPGPGSRRWPKRAMECFVRCSSGWVRWLVGRLQSIQFWPTTGIGADPSLAGNGGYTSGSTVRGLRDQYQYSRSTVQDETGGTVLSNQITGGPRVTWGRRTRRPRRAMVPKSSSTTGFDFSDAAIEAGHYTLWGYEHLYNVNGLAADESTFRTALINAFSANLGTAGIGLSTMKVGRGSDGGLVGPQ